MAPNEALKMAELKRLLRRLDGLDSQRSPGGHSPDDDTTQRDYVGTLRGTLELEGDQPAELPEAGKPVSPRSAAVLAALITAILSTATFYVLMSAEPRKSAPTTARPINPQSEKTALPPPDRGDASMELVRSAVILLEKGNIEGARELLRRAAELGSGPAALKLARSYDPAGQAQPQTPSSQSNPALARVWYERARELGMLEAQSPPASANR